MTIDPGPHDLEAVRFILGPDGQGTSLPVAENFYERLDDTFPSFQGHVLKSVRVNVPGSYLVVPKGVWHTARPNAATTLLFVTPGEGTLNAESPP